jgi:hypothetical protein
MPAEDTVNGTRHVFINPTNEGLLADVIDWFREVPGPSTEAYIKSVSAAICPLNRGQTAHLCFQRVH